MLITPPNLPPATPNKNTTILRPSLCHCPLSQTATASNHRTRPALFATRYGTSSPTYPSLRGRRPYSRQISPLGANHVVLVTVFNTLDLGNISCSGLAPLPAQPSIGVLLQVEQVKEFSKNVAQPP